MRYTIHTLPFTPAFRRVTRDSGDECDVGGDEYDVRGFASNNIRSFITAGGILAENMVLVSGNGASNTGSELLQEARDKAYIYERQEEDPDTQTVRVWGDTAIVTARLWVKGVSQGTAFDRHLWFSDVYVRTGKGWRYVFGQASLHMPNAPPASEH
jgi:ketosteroid isomerase-like protein